MIHTPREDFELLLGRHGHLGLREETIRAIRNALPMEPRIFDLLEDPERGLHAVLTRHGIASRSEYQRLVTALVKWAADSYRSSLDVDRVTTDLLDDLNLHCTDHVPDAECEACRLQVERHLC